MSRIRVRVKAVVATVLIAATAFGAAAPATSAVAGPSKPSKAILKAIL